MHLGILGSNGLLGGILKNFLIEKKVSHLAANRFEADITDLSHLRKWLTSHQFSHVFNCTGYTQVDLAEKEQDRAYAVNAEGVYHLGRLSVEMGFKLIHVSTDYVFDGLKNSPYLETDVCNPLSVYGKSKAEGEKLLVNVQAEACIVRTSWLFGKSGKNFISSLLEWMRTKEEIRVASDQVNRPTFGKDLAEALFDLKDFSGLFHVANHGPLSRFEIARDLLESARSKNMPLKCRRIIAVSSEEFSLPAPRPKYSVLDTSKFENIVGKKPRDWKEVLEDYLCHLN